MSREDVLTDCVCEDLEDEFEEPEESRAPEPAVSWRPGERRIGDGGKNLPAHLLRGLSALGLPLQPVALWSDPVAKDDLLHGHFACHNHIEGKTRVRVTLHPYGNALVITSLDYGLPGEGSGGWCGSCMPRPALLRGVQLVLDAHSKAQQRESALFPDLI